MFPLVANNKHNLVASINAKKYFNVFCNLALENRAIPALSAGHSLSKSTQQLPLVMHSVSQEQLVLDSPQKPLQEAENRYNLFILNPRGPFTQCFFLIATAILSIARNGLHRTQWKCSDYATATTSPTPM